MNDLVSIVMPAYNSQQYIEESILSVLSQTHTQWELLIVDDASTDSTAEIAASYAKRDNRIRLFSHRENLGATLARNYALQQAKGKWMAFLDSDDLWMPEKLKRQLAFMQENNCHFSYTAYRTMNETGKENNIRVTGPRCVGKTKLLFSDFMGCLTVMYDRELTGTLQITDLKNREDYALWLQVSEFAKAYYLDEDLALYRIHQSNSRTARNKGKWQLVPHHYRLFRLSQRYSVPASLFFTAMNMLFYGIRRVFYRRKLSPKGGKA